MRIRLLGKTWVLDDQSTTLPRNWDGACDPPNLKGKGIHLRKGLRGERHLEVAIHELLHALEWKWDEDAVVKPAARDIARALYRLGYRRTDEPSR